VTTIRSGSSATGPKSSSFAVNGSYTDGASMVEIATVAIVRDMRERVGCERDGSGSGIGASVRSRSSETAAHDDLTQAVELVWDSLALHSINTDRTSPDIGIGTSNDSSSSTTTSTNSVGNVATMVSPAPLELSPAGVVDHVLDQGASLKKSDAVQAFWAVTAVAEYRGWDWTYRQIICESLWARLTEPGLTGGNLVWRLLEHLARWVRSCLCLLVRDAVLTSRSNESHARHARFEPPPSSDQWRRLHACVDSHLKAPIGCEPERLMSESDRITYAWVKRCGKQLLYNSIRRALSPTAST